MASFGDSEKLLYAQNQRSDMDPCFVYDQRLGDGGAALEDIHDLDIACDGRGRRQLPWIHSDAVDSCVLSKERKGRGGILSVHTKVKGPSDDAAMDAREL